VLAADLASAAAQLGVERGEDTWLPEIGTPQLRGEDRKDLFRHLRTEEFEAVASAPNAVAVVAHARQVERESDDPFPPSETADSVSTALAKLVDARAALERLAAS
jgi:hypothetical protein